MHKPPGDTEVVCNEQENTQNDCWPLLKPRTLIPAWRFMKIRWVLWYPWASKQCQTWRKQQVGSRGFYLVLTNFLRQMWDHGAKWFTALGHLLKISVESLIIKFQQGDESTGLSHKGLAQANEGRNLLFPKCPIEINTLFKVKGVFFFSSLLSKNVPWKIGSVII